MLKKVILAQLIHFFKEVPIKLESKLEEIIRIADDKKAEGIILLDFSEVEGVIHDYFFICSGTSERQVEAIAGSIRRQLKELGYRPSHIEGTKLGKWILMDYGDLIAHIFLDTVRDFYRLEDLWHNAKKIYPVSGD